MPTRRPRSVPEGCRSGHRALSAGALGTDTFGAGTFGGRRPLLSASCGGGSGDVGACGLAVTGSSPALLARRAPSRPPDSGVRLIGAITATLTAPLQECISVEDLHEVACSLSGRLKHQSPAALEALSMACTRQCCRLLRRGWESCEAAENALPFLSGLSEAQLLSPPHEVQAATLEALSCLLGGGGGGPGGGSHLHRWHRASSSTAPPASSRALTDGARSLETSLQRWFAHSGLFARVAEVGMLPHEGARLVGGLLEVELRRSLHGATPQLLTRAAWLLREGCRFLARGISACDSALPCGTHAIGAGAPAIAKAIIADALAAAERRDRGGPATVVARDALQEAGLLDLPRLAAPASDAGLSTALASGGALEPPPVAAPACGGEWSRSATRRCTPAQAAGENEGGGGGAAAAAALSLDLTAAPSPRSGAMALESGMLQLQAAKAELRRRRTGGGGGGGSECRRARTAPCSAAAAGAGPPRAAVGTPPRLRLPQRSV